VAPGAAARFATTTLVDDPAVLPPMPAPAASRDAAAPLGSAARDAH
jgi:hypothetical protein